MVQSEKKCGGRRSKYLVLLWLSLLVCLIRSVLNDASIMLSLNDILSSGDTIWNSSNATKSALITTMWNAMKKHVPRYRHHVEQIDQPLLSPPKSHSDETKQLKWTCAINLHGVARGFAHVALPTILTNIVEPNWRHRCDYFVHFHSIEHEDKSRSGFGGALDPRELYRFRNAIHERQQRDGGKEHSPIVVAFSNSTEDEIRTKHAELIHKIKTVKDSQGLYVYQYKAKQDTQFNVDTMINIVKMWHNLQSVWNLMENQERIRGRQYDQVAMIRIDSAYVTPIDIFRYQGQEIPEQERNRTAIIPGFAEYPVNDRLVYGARQAVKVWANRFSLIDHHINHARKSAKHIGLHSEYFLAKTVFPMLRSQGYNIRVDYDICFLRTRADNLVWVDDCSHKRNPNTSRSWMNNHQEVRSRVEQILGHSCDTASSYPVTKTWIKPQIQCNPTNNSQGLPS